MIKFLKPPLIFLSWMACILLGNSCQSSVNMYTTAVKPIANVTDKEPLVEIQTPSDYDEVIVFCGNSGIGKNSLLNSIFQEHIFESGVSLGVEMTQCSQGNIYEKKKYVDTPGLSDSTLREQAALAIETALKENKNYKIVFVITLNAGRIRPDDLVTINKVCEAIKTDFKYGLVINEVNEEILELIKQNKQEFESCFLLSLNKKPKRIAVIKECKVIKSKTDQYLTNDDSDRQILVNLVNSLEPVMITAENVGKIDVINYEKKAEELELKIASITEQIHKQEQLAKLIKESSPFLVSTTTGGAITGLIAGIPTFGWRTPAGIMAGALIGGTLGAGVGAGVLAVKAVKLLKGALVEENRKKGENYT